MEKAIAIITARGGSKRIPHKNIKNFCGRPIIEYSIQAALSSGIFDEVMVSTDDEQIAEIARKAGASVPFMRSSENANDYATMDDVLREVLGQYRETGREFETFCCIYEKISGNDDRMTASCWAMAIIAPGTLLAASEFDFVNYRKSDGIDYAFLRRLQATVTRNALLSLGLDGNQPT